MRSDQFINESAKRRAAARNALGNEGGRALVTFCDIRFAERRDARDQYASTVDALQAIAVASSDRKVVDKRRVSSEL